MSSIWKTLGIERTDDRAEIRRAYARRLKVTHPEDDPAGFDTLRQAYEAALSFAERGYYRHQPIADIDELEEDEDDDEPAPLTDEHRSVDREPPEPDAVTRHRAACEAFGRRLREREPDVDALQSMLDAVLTAEAMDNLTIHAETEVWLARALLHEAPKGDLLIDRLIAHFGWAGAEGRWDTPAEVQHILERRDDLTLVGQLRARRHKHNRAFRLLTTPPASLTPLRRALLGWREPEVRDFLGQVHERRPSLMEALDPEALEWWSAYLAKKRLPWRRLFAWARGIVVTFAIIGALAVIGAALNSIPPTPEQRVKADPQDPLAWADLCRKNARADTMPPDVLKGCDTAVWSNPDAASPLNDRALAKLRARQWEAALADYEQVLALSPNDARALYGRGVARQWLNHPGAEADIIKAQASQPDVQTEHSWYRVMRALVSAPVPSKRPQDTPPPVPRIMVPVNAKIVPPGWAIRPSTLVYPPQAERERLAGAVKLSCKIAATGALQDCVIWSEDPQDHRFGDAALKAIKTARMTPGTIDGKPTEWGPVLIPFSFRLPDDEG